MPKRLAIIFFVLPCLFLNCSKNESTPSNKNSSGSAINIEGFDLFDANGVYISHYGIHDKDWHFDDSLSANELKLFNFETSFNLKNTKPSIIRKNMLAYPIPCYHSLALNVQSPDSVLLKIVITDENLNVIEKHSFKTKGDLNFVISLDEEKYPLGTARRLYFSASADHAPNYQVGFGDIKICNETDASSYNSCF